MDKNELKILALREDISAQADRIADLRADLTQVNQQLATTNQELNDLRMKNQELEAAAVQPREAEHGVEDSEAGTTKDE